MESVHICHNDYFKLVHDNEGLAGIILPLFHGVVGWSVLFDCGIHWSYSLTFSDQQLALETNVKVKVKVKHIYYSS